MFLQGRGSAEWCQRLGGNVNPPAMNPDMAQSSTAAYAHYPGSDGQLHAGGALTAPSEAASYTHTHLMVNSTGMRGMNGMTPRMPPQIAEAAVHMQYPL